MARSSTFFCSTCAAIAAPTTALWATATARMPICSDPAQLAWLKRELMRSRATWKVIATDTPLSVVTAGVGGNGAALGRGIEIADLLSFVQHAGIANTL